MRRILATAVVISGLCTITEARAQTSTPAASAKTDRESLLKADRALSAAVLSKGMSAAFGEAVAPDAIFLYNGAPVVAGRANIVALLAAQPTLSRNRIQWFPLVVAVSSDASLGTTWGPITVRPTSPQDTGAVRFAKYISTWRRIASGGWELTSYVEMGLSDEKVVMPPGVPLSTLPPADASARKGAKFFQADGDFARMADQEGAPKAFGAFAAPDGMTLPGTGEIVVGPAAISLRMAESPAAKAKWAWHPVYSEGSASGDLGFTVGEATIAVPGANGVTEYKSKYLTIWRRQPDGSIRYIVDGGNDR
jgi:ketosteroid isomerase-like protein